MKSALALVIILMAGAPQAEAAELWKFIKVRSNFSEKPKWDTIAGKAQVRFNGDRIEIVVYYDSDFNGGAPDKLPYPRIKISGRLGADGSIKATHTVIDTDTNPVNLTGRYVARSDQQIWGAKRKVVTHKEIVFSYPQSSEFIGLLADDVRDE